MSVTRTSNTRRSHDHFEPEAVLDPQAQRRLRGHMERIDYTVYASNKEVISQMIGYADAAMFQKLAVSGAQARAQWIAASLAITQQPHAPDAGQTAKLVQLRTAYEELSEAYEGLRRLVERGYLPFRDSQA